MDLQECVKEFIKEFIPGDPLEQTKELYNEAYETKFFKSKKSEALPELIVDGFDNEQIWQQIELENNELFGRAGLEALSKLLVNKNCKFPIKIAGEESEGSDDEAGEKEGKMEEEEEGEEEEEEEEEGDEEPEARSELEESEDDSDNENVKRKAKQQSSGSVKKKQKTEVDDKFFSLRQMDEYVTKMEKQEMSGKDKKKSDNYNEDDDDDDDDDDDNVSIDYFNDLPSDEEEEGSEDEIKTGKSVKYGDFFDSPDSENENRENETLDNQNERHSEEEDDEEEDIDGEDDDYEKHGFNDQDNTVDDEQEFKQKKQKKVKFNLLANSDDSDSEKGNKTQDDDNEIKSSLEAREERLRKKIEQLEKESVSEKPWQLKGEATARTRPKNSLLEEFVEFDSGLRPAPIMTEKVMMKLEDIIRSRIRDKAWDDVEKKFKPVETPLEYKKKLVMNQEKSKESLAQIYENEYIRQREALTGEDKDEQDKQESPEEIEIREKMHSLFRKLDALSNFHYTPKLAKPEIKIISNVPAVSMEEVAPVATSDATLLAPEEVKGKPKSDVLGKSERTKTDKKRERRKKKLKQHNRAIYKSQKEAEGEQKLGKKNKKNTKLDASKIKGRNVLNNPDSTDQKAVKSSTAFFTQLQNEVTTGIQEKLSLIKAKQKKNTLSAAKLKL